MGVIKLEISKLKLIIKNILKNELYLIFFLIFQETIRIIMKARNTLSISFNEIIVMIVVVAILSIIQKMFKKNT